MCCRTDYENEIDTIRDTINIISAKNYEDGIWVESFENGFPENGWFIIIMMEEV